MQVICVSRDDNSRGSVHGLTTRANWQSAGATNHSLPQYHVARHDIDIALMIHHTIVKSGSVWSWANTGIHHIPQLWGGGGGRTCRDIL